MHDPEKRSFRTFKICLIVASFYIYTANKESDPYTEFLSLFFWKTNQLTAAWLAQLGEHRSVEREVAGSSPGRTNTQGLNNNWEESAAFVMTSANG